MGQSGRSSHDPTSAPTGSELVDHIRALRRYARSLVGSPHDADDLVQETLRRILDQGDRTRIRNYRSYAYRVLHNLVRDHLRHDRGKGRTVALDEEPALPEPPSPAQTSRLEFVEVAQAIGRLPIEQREVLLLVGLEGMSYRDTAEIVGVPIGTVMSRLNRGREVLRRLIDSPRR